MLLNFQFNLLICGINIVLPQKAAAVCFYFNNLKSILNESQETFGCLGSLRLSLQLCMLLLKWTSGLVICSMKAGWCYHETSLCLWDSWPGLRSQALLWHADRPTPTLTPTYTMSELRFLLRPALSCLNSSFSRGPGAWHVPFESSQHLTFKLGLCGWVSSRLSKSSPLFLKHCSMMVKIMVSDLVFLDLDLRAIPY